MTWNLLERSLASLLIEETAFVASVRDPAATGPTPSIKVLAKAYRLRMPRDEVKLDDDYPRQHPTTRGRHRSHSHIHNLDGHIDQRRNAADGLYILASRPRSRLWTPRASWQAG